MHIKRQDPKFPHNELMLFLKYHSYLQAKTAAFESGILKNSAAVFFTDKTPTSTVNKIKDRKIQQRKQIALSLIFINLSDRNFVTGAEYILIDFRKPPKAIWFLPQEFLQNAIQTISKSFCLYRILLKPLWVIYQKMVIYLYRLKEFRIPHPGLACMDWPTLSRCNMIWPILLMLRGVSHKLYKGASHS